MTKKKTTKKKKTAKKAGAKKRKPEFEAALGEIPTKEKSGEPDDKTIRQLGTRPGPSQPDPGAEDSQAPDNLKKLDRQLSKAPQALAPVLKIPFSIWSNVSQIPEMKLTDAEALEWAEPIVSLLEYYFPGRIPEIVWIWLMFLTATEKVIDSRVKIRYEKRQERKRQQPGTAQREPAAHTTQPAPKHNGAEPATDYPQE